MCLPSKVQGYTVQKLAVLVGNLLNLNFGLIFGITPSHTRLYESDISTPLRRAITPAESAWVAGSLFVSAAVGSLVLGFISTKIGPKSVMLLSGLLQMAGWFCVHFAYDILHIYSSRIFAGIAAGAALTVMPIYIWEISQTTSAKSSLTISLECWRAIGIFIGFVFGLFLRYEYIPIVGILTSLAFSVAFPFVQESPYYFLKKGNMASFEKSMRWFRGIRSIDDRNNPEFLEEIAHIKHIVSDKAQMIQARSSTTQAIRSSIGTLALVVGAQLSGIFVILHYSTLILTSLDSMKLSSDVCIIILAGIYLMGTIIALCISGSTNRRVLLFVTSLGSVFSLLAGSAFLSYGNLWDFDEDVIVWLMPFLISAHLLCANIGFVSFSTTIFMDKIPTKNRGITLSLLHFLAWLTVFILIKYYTAIAAQISLSGILNIFTIGCVAVTMYSLFFFNDILTTKEFEDKTNIQSLSNGHFSNLHL
ncbi:facilitated trehalose transporter Tret1 [Haematobia irritans]|uniref:facilitated trehalose transporter Tret1 n=1 Tax=Haematobia irritans TaxID=7368 RepID=UPI003F4F4DA2